MWTWNGNSQVRYTTQQFLTWGICLRKKSWYIECWNKSDTTGLFWCFCYAGVPSAPEHWKVLNNIHSLCFTSFTGAFFLVFYILNCRSQSHELSQVGVAFTTNLREFLLDCISRIAFPSTAGKYFKNWIQSQNRCRLCWTTSTFRISKDYQTF